MLWVGRLWTRQQSDHEWTWSQQPCHRQELLSCRGILDDDLPVSDFEGLYPVTYKHGVRQMCQKHNVTHTLIEYSHIF